MFKNLKSLFVTGDDSGGNKTENTATPAKNTPAEVPKNEQEAPVNSASPVSQSTNTGGAVNDKFVNILFEAMEKNNLQGFDYIEFKQSLRNLAKMPMDEATRFKSAFATAQTMGATPQKLLDAATHYINVLGKEERKFQDALTHQRSKQIGDKEQTIQTMAQQIQIKQQQIEQLTKEIENDKASMTKMQEEISGASIKVEKTQNDFVASYNALVGQIQTDSEKIKKYLM